MRLPDQAALDMEEAFRALLALGVIEGDLIEALLTVHAFFVIRESAVESGERPMLDGMMTTTLMFGHDQPGVAEVEEVGIDALYGKACPFPRLLIRGSELQASLFVHEGCAYLLAAGTAAKAQNEKSFARVFLTALEALQPELLIAANMGRLLRSHRIGAEVQAGVTDYVSQVRLGALDIDLTDPMSAMIWTTFASLAAIERDLIVQRLSLGRINAWRRCGWALGPLPPGYYFDESGRFAPDPSQWELVQEMLPVLADSTLSAGEAVARLGALGVRSRGPRGKRLSDTSLATVKNPSSAIRNLLRWAPLWAEGSWVQRLRVPFPKLATFGGLPVRRLDDKSAVVSLRSDPGVPDGGWAERDVLDALMARYDQEFGEDDDASFTPRTPEVLLLAGLMGQLDDKPAELRPGENEDSYRLVRMDTEAAGRTVCRASDTELCAAMASAAAAGIRDGFDLEIIDGLVAAHADSAEFEHEYRRAADRERLRAERKRQASIEARARENANEEDDPGLAEAYKDDARRAHARVRKIEAELAKAEEPQVVDDGPLETDGDYVVRAITRIAAGGRASKAHNRALRSVVNVDAYDYDGVEMHASFHLLLPTNAGVARCGPFRASVQSRTPSYRAQEDCSRSIVHALEPATARELSADSQPERQWRRLAAAALRKRGVPELAATVVCLSVVPEVGEQVVATVAGRTTDHDPRWAVLIRAAYVDGEWRRRRRSHALHERAAQTLVDIVRRSRGLCSVTHAKRELAAAGHSERGVYHYSAGRDGNLPIVERRGNWTPGPKGDRGEPMLAWVRCVHCGEAADLVANALEVRGGLLCWSCLRLPRDNDSPTFPIGYRLLRAQLATEELNLPEAATAPR